MRTKLQERGDRAEDEVVRYLTALGWSIRARNVRIGRSEIDIVAIDPGLPKTLVFVEVRWRSRRDFGLPEETVDHAKRRRIRQAAHALLGAGGAAEIVVPPSLDLPHLPIRFDLVVVEPGPRLRHHRYGG
jgi:Holliday junction resolvase-like predicted endonuclease